MSYKDRRMTHYGFPRLIICSTGFCFRPANDDTKINHVLGVMSELFLTLYSIH